MVVGPAVVAVAVLAFAGFLERLARGARAGAPGLGRLWLVLSGGLAAMFCVQETIEGMLSSGHPGGLAGIAGQGGWLAAPLSAVVGLALAIALRGSTHAAELLTPGGSPRPALPVAPLSVLASVTLPPRRGPWLAVASARAPPGASA
jgi:hypothetical protein